MNALDWRKRIDARLEGKQSAVKRSRTASRRILAAETCDSGNERITKVNFSGSLQDQEMSSQLAIVHGNKNFSEHPSLVPPSLEPPQMPEKKYQDETRRNVRVYVMAACFVWGLVLGFLYHLSREDEVIKDDESTVAAKARTGNDFLGALPAPKQNNRKREPVLLRKTPIDIDEAGKIIKNSVRSMRANQQVTVPDLALARLVPLPKTVYGGLNGRNASLPRFDRGKSSTFIGRGSEVGLQLNSNLQGPELDF